VRTVSRGKVTGDRLKDLYQTARNTIALPHAAAARRMEIQDILGRWATVRAQMETIDAQLEEILHALPAGQALLTVPEVNLVCAATILAELGTPEDFEHPRQILKLAGMNLVERSSGTSHGRKKQSKRGRPMLRRQLFLLAGRWCLQRGLYRADYEALLARNGELRTKAVCAVARKLVPLLFAVMKNAQPFDLERWQAARHQVAACPR
jgi:transposase